MSQTATYSYHATPICITEDMITEVVSALVNASESRVYLSHVRKALAAEYGLLTALTYRDVITRTARRLLGEIYGTYVYVGPRGGVGREQYAGLEAAMAVAETHPTTSRCILVVAGRSEPARSAAVRFLRLFPDNEILVDRLLALAIKLAERDYNNTPARRAALIRAARNILAAEA